jgi:hypothetical protein
MVPIPAGQEPGVDPNAATLGGQALAGFGQQVEHAGQFIVQAEAYKAQRNRAQDVLDSTLAFQPFQRQLEQQAADLAVSGNYRTLPEDVERAGKELLDNLSASQQLTPQGKALFRVKAEEAITMARHNALGVQTQRGEQDKAFAFTTEVQQAQEDYARAATDDDRDMILGRFKGTLVEGVHAGLWHGAVAAKAYRDTFQAVTKDRAMLASRARPLESFNELTDWAKALTEGTPFTPQTEAFKNVNPEMLPTLIDDARVQMHQQAAAGLQQEKIRETKAQSWQSENEVRAAHDLFELTPTPQNIDRLERMKDQFNSAGPMGNFSQSGHIRLMGAVQSYIDMARKPPTVQDDYATEQGLSLQMLQSETPADFAELQTLVQQAGVAGRLKPETVRTFATAIESRENTMHYSNWAGYKAGKALITESLFPGATMLFPQFMDEQTRQKAAYVLDAFDAEMAPLDKRTGTAQGTTIARKLIDQFVDAPVSRIESLPKPLQVTNSKKELTLTPTSAWKTIDKLALTKGVKLRMHQAFMQAWDQHPEIFEETIRRSWAPPEVAPPATTSLPAPLPTPARPSPREAPRQPGLTGGSQYKGAE